MGLPLGFCVLAYVGAELVRAIPEKSAEDAVDRSQPTRLFTEAIAGTITTVSLLMDALGMASIMCSTERLEPYMDAGMQCILFVQLVGQTLTVLYSRYETPMVTPSLEILPFMKILQNAISESTAGRTGEYVIATLLVAG